MINNLKASLDTPCRGGRNLCPQRNAKGISRMKFVAQSVADSMD
jgi:hypothetical protein